MRPNRQETVDLVAFTEEIHNGKLHFLYSEVNCYSIYQLTAFIFSASKYITEQRSSRI